jgi:hypothetical protein
MTTINTTRRLPSRVIDADIDSLNGLGIVNDYVPVRDEASPPELKKARELMQTRQQEETEAHRHPESRHPGGPSGRMGLSQRRHCHERICQRAIWGR